MNTSKRTAAFILGTILWCSAAAQAAEASEYDQYLSRGKELLESEAYLQAMAAFETAIGVTDGDAGEARLGLATAHYRMSDYDKALRVAEGVLEATAGGELRKEAATLTVEVLRSILSQRPGGESADHSRIKLCDLRAELGDKLPADPSAGGGAGSERPSAKDMRPPVKIYTPQPPYSARARRSHIQGVVITQVIIDREGCIDRIEVLKGLHPDLDQNAMDTMSRWVFRPAELAGKPVAVYYNLTANFRLDSRKR